MSWKFLSILLAVLWTAVGLGAPLPVAATTSIVGDVVAQVGGDRIGLTVLMPAGTDPHTFEPTPRDLVLLSRARLVFINGAGLEEGLTPVLASPELRGKVVDLSAGLELRTLEDEHEEEDHAHGGVDPHVWFDPLLVARWVDRIAAALSEADPAGQGAYEARAAAYRSALEELDRWIQAEVARVPPERRLLVTDHRVLGYFAARYGFEEVGAIVPGFSTLAEPSAKEIAALADGIRRLGVPALFVSAEFNPALAAQLSRETGVRVVTLFHGSLSAPGGPAPDYLSFMRENVRRIVEALGG